MIQHLLIPDHTEHKMCQDESFLHIHYYCLIFHILHMSLLCMSQASKKTCILLLLTQQHSQSVSCSIMTKLAAVHGYQTTYHFSCKMTHFRHHDNKTFNTYLLSNPPLPFHWSLICIMMFSQLQC